jgi:hypothetical protein
MRKGALQSYCYGGREWEIVFGFPVLDARLLISPRSDVARERMGNIVEDLTRRRRKRAALNTDPRCQFATMSAQQRSKGGRVRFERFLHTADGKLKRHWNLHSRLPV